MKTSKTYLLILGLILFLLSACNVSKNLTEDEFLLHKNKIVHTDKSTRSMPLEDYYVQLPTPKSLGFFYNNVGIYYALKDKQGWFNQWLLRVFGDKPVFIDKLAADESARRMKSFLHNLSYFNADIDINYITKDKKITVEYIINPEKPYLINQFEWISTDSTILKKIGRIANDAVIKKGDTYNSYLLDAERKRITEFLRTNGYFRFNKNYINYTIDSAFRNNSLSIIAEITLPSNIKKDSTKVQAHQLYAVRDIYIYPNYEPLSVYDYDPDTLVVNIPSGEESEKYDNYHFIYYNTLKIRPRVIGQSIFLANNSLFNVKELQKSYKKLNRFPIYKYVNISFEEDSVLNQQKHLPLDVSIRLSRTKTQSYTIETDVTNTSGDLGVSGNLVYSNRNIFRGGELLSLRLSTALESRAYDGYENTNDQLFNTIESGIYLSLSTPNFLAPVKKTRFPKYLAPRSIFQLSYNFQTRPTYKRHLGNTSFGYEWDNGKQAIHRLLPIDLSIIKIFPSPEFQLKLDSINNVRLKDQYTDHFIAALKYSFTYNSQNLAKWENFNYLLLRFEVAGNLASLVNDLSNAVPSENGYYTLFGIRYAQYVRGELDFRHFYAFPNKQGFIYRAVFGLGLPYGNSSSLPFEKGFYGGGSNGMRAWAYRTLGPGAYSETDLNTFDKMGEIKLEASAEYRFPIYWYMNGAFFVDAGNVWLLEESELFPDGHFQWNKFAGQLGVDGGFGLRFDFDFFIVRLDAAVKFRDPAKPAGSRIVIGKTQISDIFWNFGIGYPF